MTSRKTIAQIKRLFFLTCTVTSARMWLSEDEAEIEEIGKRKRKEEESKDGD